MLFSPCWWAFFWLVVVVVLPTLTAFEFAQINTHASLPLLACLFFFISAKRTQTKNESLDGTGFFSFPRTLTIASYHPPYLKRLHSPTSQEPLAHSKFRQCLKYRQTTRPETSGIGVYKRTKRYLIYSGSYTCNSNYIQHCVFFIDVRI